MTKPGLKILEVGCANSIWPHYFQTYHGASVDGIDYSEIGCRKTRVTWEELGLGGTIHCADLFNPPESLFGQYDMVVSFGVVEHFKDTEACLTSCAKFLKPNGILFTMVPNMSGLAGQLQKIVDREVFDIHVPMTASELSAAHAPNILLVETCEYFMSLNLDAINSSRFAEHYCNGIIRRAFSIPTKLVWLFEKHVCNLIATRTFSPYIVSVARHRG
ncbi:MAG: class I SAM-dependent methyltransferase [Pseudomonadota bacterium]